MIRTYFLGPLVVSALGGLIFLTTHNLIATGLIGAAALLTLLVVVGPYRLGTGFVALAMFTAPQNSVRPIATADFVTFSDVFLVAGVVLLLPTILQRRTALPASWKAGSFLVVAMVLVSSGLSATPGLDLSYGLRLPAAVVALPLFFMLWRPEPRLVDALAWTYVVGHCVSTAYAIRTGTVGSDRYEGLTTHPNFFGIAAVIAIGLLIHLYHRTTSRKRWVVWAVGLICLASVVMSGSRAAALAVVALALVYPLVERSIASAYLVIALGVGFVVAGDRLVRGLGQGSVFERLKGDNTTSGSDQTRSLALTSGWQRFLDHPFQGNGFDLTSLEAHDIYLEVAIGIGIIGLLGYLAILATAIRPMFGVGPLHRLGYAAFGYAAIGLITNSLWDRFVWIGLSMSILAASTPGLDGEPRPPEDAIPRRGDDAERRPARSAPHARSEDR